MHNLSETILEDFLSTELHMYQVTLCFFPQPLELSLEDEPFVIEGKHVWGWDGYFEDGNFKNAKCGPSRFLSEIIEFLFDAVVDISLKNWMNNTLSPHFRQVKLSQHYLFLLFQLSTLMDSHFLYLP